MTQKLIITMMLVGLVGCRNPIGDTPRYKYLQHGQSQVRVDERSGRTDRLTDNGWIPISFDAPAENIPKDRLEKHVSATIIELPGHSLCYSIDNDSDYVLKEVWVSAPRRKDSTSKEKLPLMIFLNPPSGGFAPVGNRFTMCYDSKFDHSDWDMEQAEPEGATGWRQK